MIFSLIPYNVSSLGEQTDYVEDFEDDTLTQQSTDAYYGSTWIESATGGSNSYVDNTRAISGTKSYRSYRNEMSNFTFTYSSASYIEDFSVLFYTGHSTGWEKFWTFYNETGTTILNFKTGHGGSAWNVFFWEDFNGWNEEDDILTPDLWYWLNWTITGNDSYDFSVVRYSNGATVVEKTGVAPVTIVDTLFPRIVLFEYNGNNAGMSEATAWFDDITLLDFESISEEYEDEDIPPCCPFCDDTGGIGIGGNIEYRYWSDALFNSHDVRLLYTEYNVPVTGNLTRIDLQIHDNMATGNNFIDAPFSVNDVLCKVNDNALGHADELVQIGTTDYWRISWVSRNIEVDNEPLYFMFKSFAVFDIGGSDICWGIYTYGGDLNNDGQQLYCFLDDRYEGFYQTFDYGEYNFLTNYKTLDIKNDPYNSGIQSVSDDLIMRLCFDPIDTSWELQNFTNQIILGDSPICTNTSISITYFINNTAMLLDNKYLYIDKHGSGVVTGYPITLYVQDDSFYYTPTTQGTYYVNLSLNGVNVTSESFVVNCEKTDFIYTDPNPSVSGEKVKIYYGYTYATYNASLEIIGTGKEWFISPSSSGYKETTFSMSGVKYLIELNQYNHVLNKWFFVTSHIHEVSNDLVNSLTVNPQYIDLEMFTMITGSHAHFGQNVWIKVGDSYVRNVGYSDSFSFPYYPENAGKYDVKLIFKKGNSEIELAPSVELWVSGEPTDAPADDWKTEWGITGDKAQYLGWGIVIIFILIPLKAKSKYEEKFNKEVKFPAIVYLASACTGVGVSIGLGLLDIWWVLLIVLVSIASILYMIFYGKRD